MRTCAKCGKEINPKDTGNYTSVGRLSYSNLGKIPLICAKCRVAWGKHIMSKLKPVNYLWHREWKKHFEEWIGYEWKGEDLMEIERVIFT